MIEKTIHYCWFGNGELSEKEKECIASWTLVHPDWQVIRWDEHNFPVNQFEFTRRAYENKKYAFVSDYARMWILRNRGGVYLDTDYELRKPLDRFLENAAFLGLERDSVVGTAIIGMEKGHWLSKKMLDYYDTKGVVNNELNMIPNSTIITDFLIENGFRKEPPEYIKDVFVERKPIFYGSPKPEEFCAESVGIHYFRGSWWSEKERKRANNKRYVNIVRPALLFGKKMAVVILGQDRAQKIEVYIKNRRK